MGICIVICFKARGDDPVSLGERRGSWQGFALHFRQKIAIYLIVPKVVHSRNPHGSGRNFAYLVRGPWHLYCHLLHGLRWRSPLAGREVSNWWTIVMWAVTGIRAHAAVNVWVSCPALNPLHHKSSEADRVWPGAYHTTPSFLFLSGPFSALDPHTADSRLANSWYPVVRPVEI